MIKPRFLFQYATLSENYKSTLDRQSSEKFLSQHSLTDKQLFLIQYGFQFRRESVDVVVIGAGLSGLRAALNIQAAGFSCSVVEATDRVGGETLTLPSTCCHAAFFCLSN